MACCNCRTLVELLQHEIEELTQRSTQLQRINDSLAQLVSQKTPEEDKWKQKYEEQVAINQNLQKKIRQLSKHRKSDTFSTTRLPETPKKPICWAEYSSEQKENRRSSSISKMDRFMQTMVSHKVGEFCTGRSNKRAGREIVLRIVDQRLNNCYR